MAKKRYISSIKVDDKLIDVNHWMLEHGRKSPADYLMFTPVKAVTGGEVVLSFGDTESMRIEFQGTIVREGSVCVAVDSSLLFKFMTPISFVDTDIHAVVRGICFAAGVLNPVINSPNMELKHFQAESSPAIALKSLIETMINNGVEGAEDVVFYFNPAGNFYFGVFQNWKPEVEVLQERSNLIDFRAQGAGFLADVLPDAEIYHSQQVKIIHDLSPDNFYRVENVNTSFVNGMHYKTLSLQRV